MLEVNEFARPVDTRCVRRRRGFGVLRWPPARLNAVLMAVALLDCARLEMSCTRYARRRQLLRRLVKFEA